ncbi:MAG: DDE-type integrase/transposase/recombinase [Rickettsiales bacterium]|jgi:IS30 family transposase|nr:DDE-type integrase/transposase/recombinase [Rickettsiales bacterium]
MKLSLHGRAVTTPRTRRMIYEEVAGGATLKSVARKYGVSYDTVFKWSRENRKAEDFRDAHNPYKSLPLVKLNTEEQELAIFFREFIGLSLRDIGNVLSRLFRKYNESSGRDIKYSRKSLVKLFNRYGVKTPREIHREKTKVKKYESFEKDNDPGFIHMDFKYLPVVEELARARTEPSKVRSFLFAAIDRNSRWVYSKTYNSHSIEISARFLEDFLEEFKKLGGEVHTIVTDNGMEFTDRYMLDSKLKKELNIKPNEPSGKHPFDLICKKNAIEHRLIRPYHPQTNGMVERFNRRVEEALLINRKLAKDQRNFGFRTKAEVAEFLENLNKNYNSTPLQCLGYRSPGEVLGESVASHAYQLSKERALELRKNRESKRPNPSREREEKLRSQREKKGARGKLGKDRASEFVGDNGGLNK